MSRFDEAEPLLLSGNASLMAGAGPKSEWTVRSLKQLVRLYDALQKPDKADEYRKLLPSDP